MKKRYLVNLNWYGEIHATWTWDLNPNKATNNMITRMSRKLGVSKYRLRCYVLEGKNRVHVKET